MIVTKLILLLFGLSYCGAHSSKKDFVQAQEVYDIISKIIDYNYANSPYKYVSVSDSIYKDVELCKEIKGVDIAKITFKIVPKYKFYPLRWKNTIDQVNCDNKGSMKLELRFTSKKAVRLVSMKTKNTNIEWPTIIDKTSPVKHPNRGTLIFTQLQISKDKKKAICIEKFINTLEGETARIYLLQNNNNHWMVVASSIIRVVIYD